MRRAALDADQAEAIGPANTHSAGGETPQTVGAVGAVSAFAKTRRRHDTRLRVPAA